MGRLVTMHMIFIKLYKHAWQYWFTYNCMITLALCGLALPKVPPKECKYFDSNTSSQGRNIMTVV